jgi:trk system potassium uptake protein TrkA
VRVIDQDAEAFRRLGPGVRRPQVTGLGFDRQTLLTPASTRPAPSPRSAAATTPTSSAPAVARGDLRRQHVVARIYDSKRAEVYERMGIPSVATVPWT